MSQFIDFVLHRCSKCSGLPFVKAPVINLSDISYISFPDCQSEKRPNTVSWIVLTLLSGHHHSDT